MNGSILQFRMGTCYRAKYSFLDWNIPFIFPEPFLVCGGETKSLLLSSLHSRMGGEEVGELTIKCKNDKTTS